ncbi:MAG: competence/damage-inducible protein A [Clostridia bacterium]|nr:competence/damage-inducible protein A [Clostridia bacterium]
MAKSCEIIAVGTELLLGEITNTDGAYIARALAKIGIHAFYQTTVGDNPARLTEVLERAASRADIIITTGGLGPTYDDLTKETIATVFGKKLVRDEESLEHIRVFFEKRHRVMTPNNEKQADLPEGATIFRNLWGTAPACAFESGKNTVVMLPGPPDECYPMTDTYVVPYLMRYSDGVLTSRYIRVYGLGESAVEDILRDKMIHAENPTLAPYAKSGSVLLRVTAKTPDRESGMALCEPMVQEVLEILGDNAYEESAGGIAEFVSNLCRKKGKTMAFAESCTGGLVSKLITDLPGSSDVYLGGVCSYANSVKSGVLGIDPALIEEKGAVSHEVATQMAESIRRLMGTHIGLGITGIAGPGGGSEEKPVGLVYIAVADETHTVTKKFEFGNLRRSRERIRNDAAGSALDMIRKILMEEE